MSFLLGFQCLQTGIGVLEGCVHLVWCESVRFNLCHHEVFCHCEQGLGHRGIPQCGLWKRTMALCSHKYVIHKTRKIRPFSLRTSYPIPLTRSRTCTLKNQ